MGKALKKYSPPLFVLLILASANLFAQQPDPITELDPAISIGVDLSRRVRLDFTSGRENSGDIDSAKWKVSAGVSFRTKPLFKTFIDNFDSDKQHVLVVGAAYEYARASEAGVESKEHKIMLDATARYGFPHKFLISDRSRFEFRWVEGEYNFRYRNRLMLERPFKIKKFKLAPYASAEAFWNQKYKEFNQFKFSGGVQIPFVPRTTLDLYYERSHCLSCTNPHTNIFGVTLNLFFRRKK